AWPVPWVIDGVGPGTGLVYPLTPLDGFTFTAHDVTWEGRRLRLHISNSEPWTVWCALQTSYPLPGSDAYTCNGGNSAMCSGNSCVFLDGTRGTTDQNHLMMCLNSGPWTCNATGCGPKPDGIAFDMTFYADHASGSAYNHNVQLMPV